MKHADIVSKMSLEQKAKIDGNKIVKIKPSINN